MHKDPLKESGKESDKKSKKPTGKLGSAFGGKEKAASRERDYTEKPKSPIDKLDTEEQIVVAKEVVDQRKDEVQQELSNVEPNSVEESESIAGATFLELVDEKLAHGADNVEAVLDEAEAETLDIAGIEHDYSERQENSGIDTAEEVNDTLDESSENDDTESAQSTPAGSGPGVGHTPPATTPPQVPPVGVGGNALPPSGGGHNFNAQQPIGGLQPQFEQSPSRSIHEIQGAGHVARRAFIAGGVIGYLVGRRRGRIKTEAKLLPVQKSLETEVHNLQQTILAREQKVRNLVSDTNRRDPDAPQKMLGRIHTLQEFKYPEADRKKYEGKTHATNQPEKVGKFILDSENLKSKNTLRPVDQMHLGDVLQIASKITVESSNLKGLFEAGKLDEKGLRRVVRAYLRGERYDVILTDELKTPEVIERKDKAQEAEASVYYSQVQAQTDDSVKTTDISQTKSHQSHASDAPGKSQRDNKQAAFITVAVVIAIVVLLIVR